MTKLCYTSVYLRKDIEMGITLKTRAKVCYGEYESFEKFDVEITTLANSGWADGKLVLRVIDTPGCWLVRNLLDIDPEHTSIKIYGDFTCINFNVIMSELKTLLCDPSFLSKELTA